MAATPKATRHFAIPACAGMTTREIRGYSTREQCVAQFAPDNALNFKESGGDIPPKIDERSKQISPEPDYAIFTKSRKKSEEQTDYSVEIFRKKFQNKFQSRNRTDRTSP